MRENHQVRFSDLGCMCIPRSKPEWALQSLSNYEIEALSSPSKPVLEPASITKHSSTSPLTIQQPLSDFGICAQRAPVKRKPVPQPTTPGNLREVFMQAASSHHGEIVEPENEQRWKEDAMCNDRVCDGVVNGDKGGDGDGMEIVNGSGSDNKEHLSKRKLKQIILWMERCTEEECAGF